MGVEAGRPRSPATRVQYLELLRAAAILAVVVIHASITEWHALPTDTPRGEVLTWINSVARFCVPVFFMISGALLLDPERTITWRSLFGRRIPRLLVAFAVWSLFFALVSVYGPGGSGSESEFVESLVTGHFHLWFLLALTGLYLGAPILRLIARNTVVAWYFVALAVPFAMVLPMLEPLPVAGELLADVLDATRLHLVLGYSSYFLLGFLLSRTELDRRQLWAVAAAGALGLAATGVGTSFASRASGGSNEFFLEFLSLNVALPSVAIFCLAKAWGDRHRLPPRAARLVSLLAVNAFGIYLVHPFFQWVYRQLGLTTEFAPPLVSVPVLAVLVLLPSLLVAACLRRVPRAGPYLG